MIKPNAMNPAATFEGYQLLKFRRDGGVLNVTIDNPERRNALSGPGELEIARFFYEVTTDDATRAIVLTGAGTAFSAGGDVEQMRYINENPRVFYAAMINAKRVVGNMLDCPKPIIAKVNGPAAGLGATVALMCDVVFAADHAKFSDPHVKMGFTAGDGGAMIWPYLFGGQAKHYLMTGDPILATDAERLGAIFKAVPAADLDAVVDAYAKRLATGPRRAIETSKLTANIVLKQLAAITGDAGICFEALTNYSVDHHEATQAFIEKRPPNFTGE
ncbi:Enoyl-CoA hydratase/isomerase [Burkholderia sp. H160]|nr:Enoyl-CoA hydratase/isomerase [Burkholderia sp. H160]